MLGPSADPSASNFEPGKAVVVSLARTDDRGLKAMVFCLDTSGMGEPFPLRNQDGWYIWPRKKLREIDIGVGSIISYQRLSQVCLYSGNTGMKMDVSDVVTQLPFRRLYSSIKDAFPSAVIGENRGLYQEYRPKNRYTLISISHAVIEDDRIILQTAGGEEVNLSNRSLTHTSNSIERVTLPGGFALIGFGSNPTIFGRFQAMCEGIILKPAQGAPRLGSYDMSRVPRGLCLIINNLEFEKKELNRYGGEVDEKMLFDLFSMLSFEVSIENDLKYNKMLEIAEEFAAKDHSDYDAFIMIVMSHGGDGDAIYGVQCKHAITVKDLMAEFRIDRCPSLEGKPKIFFVQACRGSLDEREAPFSDGNGYMADAMAGDSTLAQSVTPLEADFLLAFATTPGYVSFRNTTSGSEYIKVLVDVIKKYRQDYHLLDMLTEVNRVVAERVSDLPGGKQQIPAPVNTLRAQVFLKDL